jgi:hypothetical protein
MFEFIDRETLADALPAGHDAIRFIRCWAAAMQGYSRSFEGLSKQQSALAKRIIVEIETAEGMRISEIPQSRIESYINMIFERLQAASRRELHPDLIRGKSLLDKLRLAVR